MNIRISPFFYRLPFLIVFAVMIGCGDSDDTSIATGGTSDTEEVTETTVETDPLTSVNDALAENKADHESGDDYTWSDGDIVYIRLNGTSINVEGAGALASGSTVTISSAGTYSVNGTLTDGQLIIDTEDEATVKLILNGVTMSNSSSAPVFISNAEKVSVILATGTVNTLTDSDNYIYPNADTDEPNAALFSKADLSISGDGVLTINANYNDGLSSKDGLIIKSGTLNIKAADDGIRGKDYLVIKGGTIDIEAGGDGLKSDNDEDADRGYVYIQDGVIAIVAEGDGIQGETDVLVTAGEVTIRSGGGNAAAITEDESAKALKAGVYLIVDNGSFDIDAADDALHCDQNLVINGGTMSLATGDDAIHADLTIGIAGGDISITKSYEGIESAVITINDGVVNLVSSDDGINGSGDSEQSQSNYLYINGGNITVTASGDGIDVNGSVEMNGGVVVVHGPTANNNAPLDYDRTFKITGGFLVAAGSSGMAQIPGTSSTQRSVLLTFPGSQSSSTLVHIENIAGKGVLTFQPSKQYQSIAFSSVALTDGTYTVYTGGTATGTLVNGLYTDGTYSGGSQLTTFEVNSATTKVSVK